MTKAAVIQMTSNADSHENLRKAYSLLQQAAHCGAQLAVLPENFSFMGMTDQDKFRIAEQDGDGLVQAWLARTARELNVWIVAGTVPLKLVGESRVAAACLVFNAQGERVARYDKMHLFDVDVDDSTGQYRESTTLVAGQKPVLVDTPIGRVGLAICYDLRFPELFRHYSASGAEVLVVPAAFTVPTGRSHWEVLLRARAIENLCYVLAAGQTGLHSNGRTTYGHSMVIDPWGEVVNCQSQEVGWVIADINLHQQRERRGKFPVLSHRRL